MKKIVSLASLSCMTVLTACNAENGALHPPASLAQSETVMTVNDKPIKAAEVDFITKGAKQRNGQEIPRQMILDELVTRELLFQEAEKQKLAEDPDVAMQLYMVQRTVLSQAAQMAYFKQHPVTEADVQAAYKERFGGTSGTEYKARHILLKTEEDAKQVITELDTGKDFAELAKAKSTGPSSAKGGDLGWFGPKQMVPPFTEGVQALADGEYTKAPIKTRFGWHVILREQSRAKAAPAMDSVKPQIEAMKQREQFQKYMETLKAQANIVNLEKTEAEPAAPSAATPAPAPVSQAAPQPAAPQPQADNEQAAAPAEAPSQN